MSSCTGGMDAIVSRKLLRMGEIRTRNAFGQFLPGVSGNEKGRLPRQTETKYLEIIMEECTGEQWAEVIRLALQDALDMENSAHIRARAREWLAKYLIGEPSQLHQLLYKEERKFEIVVTFGDNEKLLGDVVDVEPVLIDAD